MGCCQSQDSGYVGQTAIISVGEVRLGNIFAQVKPKIEKAVDFLKRCDDFSAQAATGSLEVLVHHASVTSGPRQEVAKHLQKLGYGKLYVKMAESLEDYRRGRKEDPRAAYNLMIIQMAFWNYTDVCSELGRDLGDYGGVAMLLTDLDVLHKHLNNTTLTEYVEVLLGILHNAIHLYGENRPIYRRANAVDILTRYLEADDMTIKIKALMVLAYCMDEEESGVLATANGCVSFLTCMLNEAVAAVDHRAISGNSRFGAKELLDSLNHLAMNDTNKREIQKEGGIKSIAKMLQEGFSEEEHRLAAEAMWNLSFIKDIRQDTLITQCTSVLEELSTSDNEGLRQASTFALWEINDGDKGRLPAPPPAAPTECTEPSKEARPDGEHVMISYQWDSQHIALGIKERLEGAGLDVWLDVEKMKGNLLHAMAEAIEQSAVVVVCMSQKYKESLNCRSEASYAYKKQKPIIGVMVEDAYEPDGWLGLLLGMQLYHNAYSDELMRKNIPRIIDEIKEKGYEDVGHPSKGVDVIDSPTIESQQESQVNALPALLPASPGKDSPIDSPQSSSNVDITDKVRSWSKLEVQQWFEDNNVEELSKVLDYCDGKHLLAMYNPHKQSPESLQMDLKTELELGFNTRLKFTTALEELLKQS